MEKAHAEPWKCLCVYCCIAISFTNSKMLDTLNRKIDHYKYDDFYIKMYDDKLNSINELEITPCVKNLVDMYEMLEAIPCLLMDSKRHINTAKAVKMVKEKYNEYVFVQDIADIILTHLYVTWPIFASVGDSCPF